MLQSESYAEVALSPRKCQSDSVDRDQQKTKNKAAGSEVKRKNINNKCISVGYRKG